MSRHRIDELTREEVRSRASAALAVVTIGACEQHGPHLPLGTDTIVVDHIATRAAQSAGTRLDVLVTPAIAVGYSPHHTRIGPTLTSAVATIIAQLTEICESLTASGFSRIFILNGHGGNAELVAVAARAAAQAAGVRIGAGSYWTMAWQELEAMQAQSHGRVPGHSGAFETSLMLAIRPDLVDAPPSRPMPFRPNPPGYFGPYFVEDPDAWAAGGGFTDDPSRATAQRGDLLLQAIIPAVAGHLVGFAEG